MAHGRPVFQLLKKQASYFYLSCLNTNYFGTPFLSEYVTKILNFDRDHEANHTNKTNKDFNFNRGPNLPPHFPHSHPYQAHSSFDKPLYKVKLHQQSQFVSSYCRLFA